MRDIYLSPDTGDIVFSAGGARMVEGAALTEQLIRNEILEPRKVDPDNSREYFGTNIETVIGSASSPVLLAMVQGESVEAIKQVQRRYLENIRLYYNSPGAVYADIVNKASAELLAEITSAEAVMEDGGTTISVTLVLRTAAGKQIETTNLFSTEQVS